MRILQASVRYPPAPGGAETHVREVSEGLAKRGHEVTVVTTDLYREVPFEPKRAGWMDKGVPVIRRGAYTLGAEMHYVLSPGQWRDLVRLAKRHDVVHAHSYGYGHTVAAAFAAQVAKKPFVFTPHYHPPWSMEGGQKRGQLRAVFDKTLGPYTMRAANAVVAVSSGELDLIQQFVPFDPRKAHVIPNGIHLERYRPVPEGKAFRDAYGLKGRFILYAGRLASNKGLHHLVEAFAQLPRDLTLVLAGSDQDQGPRLKALAERLGVSDRVLFTGHLPDHLYGSAFAACDVFCLPSEYEAFGIVLLEAMACGKPCVATRVGGSPDVVRDGQEGLLVPYGDVPALAKALERVLSDPKLAAELGQRGMARVTGDYTWGSVVERLEGLYRTLA
ncbi:MAG TPA: glycosyltransferase family 4 protein [Candidatus Thermoplasmatota archaeon]|nr:glycosyltransferase family 4 protein [Candidatus Thermoplasmatota archaeon]